MPQMDIEQLSKSQEERRHMIAKLKKVANLADSAIYYSDDYTNYELRERLLLIEETATLTPSQSK